MLPVPIFKLTITIQRAIQWLIGTEKNKGTLYITLHDNLTTKALPVEHFYNMYSMNINTGIGV
jgi:hypothetical protein